MGELNNEELMYKMPLIGDVAPEFRAITTEGKINFPSDFFGSWVLLFSHPADFTPVCTTEFIALAKKENEFRQLNTRLLGLSIDSLSSHLAWLKSIEGLKIKGESVKVKIPIIADVSMNVAKKYGMLHTVAKTQTVRAVYIIDPNGVIRSIMYYPMCTGRNIDELLRIIESLQMHDGNHISTPANWVKGEDVVLSAPLTYDELDERLNLKDEAAEVVDWYLTYCNLFN